MLWLTLGMCALSVPAGSFIDLFAKNDLKLDLTDIGHINAYAMIPSLLLTYPTGWLIDRFGPRLIWSISSLAGGLTMILGYFLIHDITSVTSYYIIRASFDTFAGVALMPMLYAYLPKGKFGQLVSTQSLMVQTMIFLSTNASGQLISWSNNQYRIVLLYAGPFLLLTPLFAWALTKTKNPFAGQETAFVQAKKPESSMSFVEAH